ncbi:MAG TPA: 5-formyltetrahydrofolate cyclo-ligase [Verrucomicrobiae bacterium]|nr:5-formyltetrahydrofolate cyclo-ligase [Verrucomicrobiae bacterium]
MLTSNSKSDLRQMIRAMLEKISPAVRAVESIELCERLKSQMPSAHTILFFAPLPNELDVWPVLELSLALGTTCALPFFDAEKKSYGAKAIQKLATDIVPGKFGVREPAASCTEIPLDKFDLVLVPGVAFDLLGNRLGRGQGFYDRLLQAVSGVKCAICYDLQLRENIPTEPHDAKVDFVLTPGKIVNARRNLRSAAN